ncbi:unnamed protein product [Polarella glacialis]|uniref:Uncharacterized protein n=1 Tax=Polarella glacialis TaxID=89957 RepID=A0A813EFX1_POLGL|nr:unnamed protein product [Polarella glacialis]CAE8635212.1 unnamed protein product [Polarella glacialis]
MMNGLQPISETATSQASGARDATSPDSATAASRKLPESRASTAVLAHGVLQVPATATVCGSFMADILQQVCTVRVPDQFEPAAGGICGDCKSGMIWRVSIPNFFKPLEDQVSTGGQSQVMSLCTLPGIRCPATPQA